MRITGVAPGDVMFAAAEIPTWFGAAAVVPAVVFVTWATRALGRWLGRAITATMAEAITQTVQPQLTAVRDQLVESLNQLRSENRVDHEEVAKRLTAVEERVAAIEARLPQDPQPAEEATP